MLAKQIGKTLFSVFILIAILKSFTAQAFVFTVSEKQLNVMLALSFPIKREYQGVSATFLDPFIELDALDQKVLITTSILAMHNGKPLRATGTIVGVFEYDAFEQQLQFKKPRLKALKVIDNQINEAEQAVKTLKQTIGRNLPVIILVDFKQFKMGLGDIVPKEIDITTQGLAITL